MSDIGNQENALHTRIPKCVEPESEDVSEDSDSSLSNSPRISAGDVDTHVSLHKAKAHNEDSTVTNIDDDNKKKKKKTLFKNIFRKSNDNIPQLLEEGKITRDKDEHKKISGFERIKGFLLEHSPPESGTLNALISPRFTAELEKKTAKKPKDEHVDIFLKEDLDKKKYFFPFIKKNISGSRDENTRAEIYEDEEFVLPVHCRDSLESLIKDPVVARVFYDFCVKEHSEVNFLFWLEAVAYQRGEPMKPPLATVHSNPIFGSYSADPTSAHVPALQVQAEALFYNFIAKGAHSEITIHPSLQNQIAQQIQNCEFKRDMFDRIIREVYDDISLDAFKRFCQSYDSSGKKSSVIPRKVNRVDSSTHDEHYKSRSPIQSSTPTSLRGSPKAARRDSRPVIPQLHLQSISPPLSSSLPNSTPPSMSLFSPSIPSPRVGSLTDSPRMGMHEHSPRPGEPYGVAFGIRRGACAFPCDCEYYQPHGDNGGQCQNCGHFPATHQNLGKLDAVSPDFKRVGRTIRDISPRVDVLEIAGSPQASEEMACMLPQQLNNWIIDADEIFFAEKIGEGNNGKVYKGLWRNQEVAIKVLKNTPDGKEMQEFSKEVEMMSLLRSPCIVYFYGMTFKPKVCMVMEYCARKSLYHVMLSKVDITWDRALTFSIDAVRGINSFHNWNPPILHRDLKTLNLLVTDNWAVKIADFGLSRFTTGDLSTLSKVRGTYAYCAPEVYFGKQFTTKSDIYSMGIVLWELVTRCMHGRYERPFAEFKHIQYDFQIIIQSAKENLRPTLPSGCPEEFSNLISMCWDPNPDLRPSSAQVLEILTGLEAVYQEHKKKWDRLRDRSK